MSQSKNYVALVGSRDYHNYQEFSSLIDKTLKEWSLEGEIVIVSGGAKGADALAEKYAKERKYGLHVFSADWKKFGLSAGPKRNSQIVDIATHMIAFPSDESKGTYDSLQKADKKGIPVKTFIIEV
jgi:hypothetical protein